jgi:hypothetical protein
MDAGQVCARSTLERPSTGFNDPDAANNLPASLNLALCCSRSGANEAHCRLLRKAANEHGCFGSTVWSAGILGNLTNDSGKSISKPIQSFTQSPKQQLCCFGRLIQ